MEKTQEQLRADQISFARSQMSAENRESQRQDSQAEIKIKLIENGILVKAGPSGWFTFPDWPTAGKHIAARLEALRRARGIA